MFSRVILRLGLLCSQALDLFSFSFLLFFRLPLTSPVSVTLSCPITVGGPETAAACSPPTAAPVCVAPPALGPRWLFSGVLGSPHSLKGLGAFSEEGQLSLPCCKCKMQTQKDYMLIFRPKSINHDMVRCLKDVYGAPITGVMGRLNGPYCLQDPEKKNHSVQ